MLTIDFQIASRNLLRHTRRNVFLGGALAATTALLVLLNGLADGMKLRQRVVAELKTTFASHYTQVVSLQEALQLSHIAVYGKRATGEKYLINPNKA